MPSHQQSPDQSQAAATPGSGPDSGAGYGNNAEADMAAGNGAADNTATGGLEGEGSDEAVIGGNSLPEGGKQKAGGGTTDLADSEAGPGSTIPGNEVTGKTA